MIDNGLFTFQVYIISSSRYKRGPITAKHFVDYKHVVKDSQKQLYEEAGFKNVISFPDHLINSYAKVYNYLVENMTEDVIAIVDDDIDGFQYRTAETDDINDPEIVQAEFERLAQIIWDLDLGLAFGPPNAIPYNYTSEFSWFGVPGAWKIVNRKCNKSTIDATLERGNDVDYVLQEVMKNRVCIDCKYLCGKNFVDKDSRATGEIYSKNGMANSIERMELRWGKYFRYDRDKNIPHIEVDR